MVHGIIDRVSCREYHYYLTGIEGHGPIFDDGNVTLCRSLSHKPWSLVRANSVQGYLRHETELNLTAISQEQEEYRNLFL